MGKNFVWHYDAAAAVFLKSEGIAQACEEQAARMTRATGMEYQPDVRVGKRRIRAMARGKRDGETVKGSKKFRKREG